MNKSKKGMLMMALSAVVIMVVVYMFKDDRDMTEVEKAQEADIEQVASETLSEDNDLFSDDVDFGDIEVAPLALDTTKSEKL